MDKKAIYIDLAVTDDEELNLEDIQKDLLNYFYGKGLIVGGNIDYCD